MSSIKYLLDANVFIEAANRYYAFDMGATKFWSGLEKHGKKDNLCTIDRVADEVKAGKDRLAQWMIEKFKPYCYSTDQPEVISSYGLLMKWSETSQFTDTAKKDFAKGVDAWLVAYAVSNKLTVVTHETFNKDVKRKIKIPNACTEFEVPWVDTFDLMRSLKIQI